MISYRFVPILQSKGGTFLRHPACLCNSLTSKGALIPEGCLFDFSGSQSNSSKDKQVREGFRKTLYVLFISIL